MKIEATIIKIVPYLNYAGYYSIHLNIGFHRFESIAVHNKATILEDYKLSDEQFANLLN